MSLSLRRLQRFLSPAAAPSRSFLTTIIRKLNMSIEIDSPVPNDQINLTSSDLCRYLIDLAVYLPEMAELNEFRLRVPPDQIAILAAYPWSRMLDIVISSLPKMLTNLTIDLAGDLFSTWFSSEDHHSCSLLLSRDHLPCLRHLRICTRTLCPEIFEQLSSKPQLHLTTLVIYLCLGCVDGGLHYHTIHCTSSDSNFESFPQEMLDATKAAKSYLPSATTLRVIYHKLPFIQNISHDVVSERVVALPDSIAWTDVNWEDDGYTDRSIEEESDVESFVTYSSNASEEAPWIDVEEEAALQ